ncbi:hypothetical protein MSG28_008847 [Choristoneura fumiferana]|uniref:Uncharacterized protein n=1 Tax=Choristoneura fumiferana TaxID=7141 RepID=A0ACC0J878_CHOFU|nr:hypothetical protein MSG28_008847 [Choristoneura fumiferana]
MGHSSCCVVNCKNTGRNSKCKFYCFPTAPWKVEQRKKWITAVKRKNADGSPWYPKPSDLICSGHFIGGKKSDESASPSYVPTIFPPIYRSKIPNESVAISRFRRFMARRKKKELSNTIPTNQPFIPSSETCHQWFDSWSQTKGCVKVIFHRQGETRIEICMAAPAAGARECNSNTLRAIVANPSAPRSRRYKFQEYGRVNLLPCYVYCGRVLKTRLAPRSFRNLCAKLHSKFTMSFAVKENIVRESVQLVYKKIQ